MKIDTWNLVGRKIDSVIIEAIALSANAKEPVTFEFNGVNVTVTESSNKDLIYRDWDRALQGFIDKNVGPSPSTKLTPAELCSDATKRQENEQRQGLLHEEYLKKERAKKDTFHRRLASKGGDSTLNLRDHPAWGEFVSHNKDPYGKACVQYASNWMLLMQLELEHGKKLEDIAELTSREADTEGITGFMYGCAVSMIAKCWKHGDQLRRWHNKLTQIGTEGDAANESGGVLNPALLNIK